MSCHLCARLLLIFTDKSWFALKSNVSISVTFETKKIVGFCFALVYLLDKTYFGKASFFMTTNFVCGDLGFILLGEIN